MTEEPAAGTPPAPPAEPIPDCPHCRKPLGLCVCEGIERIDNKVSLLILQHPQEQDRELGTASLAHLQLKNSRVVVGLSWPGLAALLGRAVDPRRWGVLYLGPVKAGGAVKAGSAVKVGGPGARPPLAALSSRGNLLDDQGAVLGALDGVILLDGSWGQAKALWWRNPWLLKLRRLVLAPDSGSLYGRLRREPRADSVSTIEAAALCLAALERNPALVSKILHPFAALLERYKERAKSAARR
jgi:DTW domain-containing protein YfiP